MGLFEEAGRRFERFKQQATAAAEEEAEYECTACGEQLFAAADTCSECDAGEIVPIEPVDEGSEDSTSDQSGEEPNHRSDEATSEQPDEATSERPDDEPSDDGGRNQTDS